VPPFGVPSPDVSFVHPRPTPERRWLDRSISRRLSTGAVGLSILSLKQSLYGETIMFRTLKFTALTLLAAVSVVVTVQAQQTSLYDNLGGKKAIVAVVDDFVGRVAADNRIHAFFAATAADPKRLAAFKSKLVDQICEASGGPCKYRGKGMKEAHAGMGISGADFSALVSDLVAALDKFHDAAKDKDTLLGVLGPMQSAIVEK
jgi:hemoglobin